MKTIKMIKNEIAKECHEIDFDLLVETEIAIGDYETARILLIDLVNRYIDQYKEE